MKKILIFMLTLLLSACTANKHQSLKQNYAMQVFLTNDQIDNISSVFEKEISEAADILQMGTVEQDKTVRSEWKSDIEAVFGENSYEVILLSYQQNDSDLFYGVNYRCVLPENAEESKNIINEIYNEALKEYGDPDTYPGLYSTVESEEVLQALKNKDIMTYYDEWNISDSIILIVQVETSVPVLNIIYKQI